MAEPLKAFFSTQMVKRLGESIKAVYPAFALTPFIRDASRGLDSLELLPRAKHIASQMAKHLPSSYPEAVDILLRSLGPEHAGDELEGVGMGPFFYLPHTIFVAEKGLDHFDLSMNAQRELTKRFTAEFSIRFYIARYPEKTFEVFERWVRDPNPHIRRLVSEGTRPRLPWASRVAFLDNHPERALALLEHLKDDPASLVRRSVANHLNDVGKAHPNLLVEVCTRWGKGAAPERKALIEHALRSAVKRGEKGALQLTGHGRKAAVRAEDVRFTPKRVAIGQKVQVTFTLRSTAEKQQSLLVDLKVHFVKKNGSTAGKVFKLTRLALEAGQTAELSKSISLAVHTTRTPYPGKHEVEALVNGQSFPLGAFEVLSGS
ncbi:MAG: DNA alkylation repair protein [Polyangiaceae bacterium]|nr:DNA alkylation repair protein [Polyangiaceae bacterium]